MKCLAPVALGVRLVGCGQCMPCRLNRRRLWMHRMMLEAQMHGDCSFLTLTYDDEHLPNGSSLEPKDAQDWLKRFRKRIAPLHVRYYLVGEYGDETWRPHYHAALFGFGSCTADTFTRSYRHKSQRSCCFRCDLVRDTWGKGGILLGQFTPESAQYVVGYVTKKMTSKEDPRLTGRYPEFARMSRRPGLGHGALEALAESIVRLNLDVTESDVPSSLRHGKKLLPLGRYLQRKLRVMLGRDPDTPKEVMLEKSKEMLAMFINSEGHYEAEKFSSYKEKVAASSKSIDSRARIFKRRGQL